MIPKKVGNYMVMDLQALLLYDTEFNATLKWLGRIIEPNPSMHWPLNNTVVALTMQQFIKA